MKCILTYLCLFCIIAAESQIILPGYKDGNYWIIRSDKNIALDKSIISLENFDSRGYAVFESDVKTGILDSSGAIVHEDGESVIQSWGRGVFVVSNSENKTLIDFSTRDTLVPTMKSFQRLNTEYFSYFNGKDTMLFHMGTKSEWIFQDYDFNKRYFQSSILVQEDSLTTFFYTPKGEKICIDSTNLLSPFVVTYAKDEKQYAVSAYRMVEVPLNTSNIYVGNNYLGYSDGKKAYLVDLEQDRIIASGPYDQIRKFNPEGYLVLKNDRYGLMDISQKLRIQIRYESIYFMNDHYYVKEKGLTGLMDENYVLRIPCDFTTIWSDTNFYYTFNTNDMQGLYGIDYKPILRTMYNRISIRNRLIKAYRTDKLRILKLDLSNNVVSDVILDNAITAKQKLVDDFYLFDKRLIPLGWFYEREAITDSVGIIRRYRYTWGLKNGDSILLSPRFGEPLFVPDAGFSIVNGREVRFKMDGLKYHLGRTQSLMDYTNGKYFDKESYLFFNQNDGYTKNYYRCATTKGYAFYNKTTGLEKVDYISSTSFGLIPYAINATFKREKEGCKECLKYMNWLPVNFWRNELRKSTMYSFLWERAMKLENAEWNYKDSLGLDRFEEPFTFANDYFRKRAIAKRKTGWGVVDEYQTIIPFEYSDIKRLHRDEDYTFLVKKNVRNKSFIDSSMTELASEYKEVYRSKGGIAALSSKQGIDVFHNGERIEKGLRNIKMLSNDYWSYRKKRVNYVANNKGVVLFEVKNKPILILSDDYILVESSGKKAIQNRFGDTVVPFDRFEFEEYENFYFLKGRNKKSLYDKELNLLRTQKKNEIIIPNKFSHEYAVVKKSQIKRFNSRNELLKKEKLFSTVELQSFQHELLVGSDFLHQDSITISLDKSEKLKIYPDGMVQIRDKKDKNTFYAKSIAAPVYDLMAKKVKYLGRGIITFVTDDHRIVKNGDLELLLPLNSIPVGDFEEEVCLFQNGSKYMYVNIELKIVFSKHLQKAYPFEMGRARVRYKGGWTLLSKKGKLLGYPSYSNIKNVSTNFFETTGRPKYGLYDSSGNVIIPAIYERITFINSNIIQVVLRGEMGYFNIKGEEIFSIQ